MANGKKKLASKFVEHGIHFFTTPVVQDQYLERNLSHLSSDQVSMKKKQQQCFQHK
jgi:hypothetical protein